LSGKIFMGQAVLLLFNIVVSHPCTFDNFSPGLRHNNLFIVTNLPRDLAVRFKGVKLICCL